MLHGIGGALKYGEGNRAAPFEIDDSENATHTTSKLFDGCGLRSKRGR
jgi:hypothetical protein